MRKEEVENFYKNTKIFIENNLINKNNKINSNYIKINQNNVNNILQNHWAVNVSELYYCINNNILEEPKCYCGNKLKYMNNLKKYRIYCNCNCKHIKYFQLKNNIKKENILKDIENFYKETKFFIENNLLNSKNYISGEKIKKNISKINNILNNHWAINMPELYYCILNKINEQPKCYCDNFLKFDRFSKGYFKYCSIQCRNKDPLMIKKIKETNLEKYGNFCSLHNKNTQQKVKQTNLKKYGVLSHSQKHIKNFHNLNSVFINNNFKNSNGKLEKSFVLNYFNINTLYFNKYKNNKIKFNDLLPFEHKNDKTQTEIFNIFFKQEELNYYLRFNDKRILSYNIDNKIKNLELDILDLNNNIAIEYNGLMYHSFGKNNYTRFNNYQLEENKKNFHKLKTDLCEEKGIQLFHIMEHEWLDKIKQKIWISIINEKLNKNECLKNNYEIKFINDIKIIKDFLNNNNLKGYNKYDINIGLFINDELFSLMSFNKIKNIDNIKQINNNYELKQFCNKIYYSIHLINPNNNDNFINKNIKNNKDNNSLLNSFDILVEYFEINFNPKSLIITLDRRYENKDLYINNGFQILNYIEPQYYYFLPEKLSKLKNKKDITKNNFEDFIENKEKIEKLYKDKIYENGYRKFYDSGYEILIKNFIIKRCSKDKNGK